jgi:hypothetical protein
MRLQSNLVNKIEKILKANNKNHKENPMHVTLVDVVYNNANVTEMLLRRGKAIRKRD